MSAIDDRRFMARAGWALVCAHARYWSSVAPLVRSHLRRWETHAAEIPDPSLRSLALGKLANERFNVEVAAMIATVAPARRRERTVEAIVALQVMYDFLDALTEQPSANPIRDGLQYSKALTNAASSAPLPAEDYYAHHPGAGSDAGYLAALARAVHTSVKSLPAVDAISSIVPASATRCAEAQVRIHAAPSTGMPLLERWASAEANGTELAGREWLFGAMGSVVAVHALIALAADEHSTPRQARELDDVYLSLCVLTTVLDHLVDYERDQLTGEPSYIDLYDSRDQLADEVTRVSRRVMDRARAIPNGPHHMMILAGVVAYYTSQPSAMGDFARPVTEHARDQLRPLITPTLATMRAWRLAKRLRASTQEKRLADNSKTSGGPGTEQKCGQSRRCRPEKQTAP
jgi:tetraprenyl-beta-curcumene synthase